MGSVNRLYRTSGATMYYGHVFPSGTQPSSLHVSGLPDVVVGGPVGWPEVVIVAVVVGGGGGGNSSRALP